MANTPIPMRERINLAAYDLLVSHGPAGLSMRNLALNLHIKAPSLYKHIDGKDDLIAYLQARGLTSFRDFIAKAGVTGREKALAYRSWAVKNPYLYEITMRTPLLREKLPTGLEDSVTATIVSLAGGDRGKARAMWSLVHGMVDLELANRFPKDADLDQMWDQAIKLID
jgi:AcrR family transcriptional regulator